MAPDVLRAPRRSVEHERAAFQAEFRKIHPRYNTAVYPPPLFAHDALNAVRGDAARVVELVASIPSRVFGGDVARWFDYLGFRDDYALEMFRRHPALCARGATMFARPDFLVCDSGFALVEVNVGPALGGIGTCDRYARLLRDTPFARALAHDGFAVQAESVDVPWLEAVRSLLGTAAHHAPLAFIAVADPSELTDDYHIGEAAAAARRGGFRTKIGLIGELDVSARAVRHGGTRVDVVYCYYSFPEIARYGVPVDLLRRLAVADEDGVVTFIGVPSDVPFANKLNLEILTSPRYAHLWPAAERALAVSSIPCTRRLTRDTVDEVRDHQQRYVLKPAAQYGGRGVVIGEAADARTWAGAVAAAASGKDGAWIVQDRAPDLVRYRSGDGELRSACVGALVFSGRPAGMLLREARSGAATPIINTAQGAAFGTAVAAVPAGEPSS